MYRDSGDRMHFLFFTTQFYTPSLKIAIPKQYKKVKIAFSLTEKQNLF